MQPQHNTSGQGLWITYLVLAIVLAVLSVPTLLFAVWAAYDGFVHYPELVQRWNAYENTKQTFPLHWQTEWTKVANQNGWPTETPRKMAQKDVVTQYILMGFCGVMGIAMVLTGILFFWLMKRAGNNARHPPPTPG